MPSLASFAKNVLLTNKLALKPYSAPKVQERQHITPLPLGLSDRIPQELYERFIECLYGDRASLAQCSLVCRMWWPACRYRLKSSMTVLPSVIVENANPLEMNCAVPLVGTTYILYGSHDGVYMVDRRGRTTPRLVLEVPNVVQIDALVDHNLLVLLSGNQLVTHPLDALDPITGPSINECIRVATQVAFFKVGSQLEKMFICIVKSSNVIKILQPVPSPISGRSMLALYKEFYLPTKVISLHFLRTRLVFGISHHGFQVVDIESLSIQPLLDPSITTSDLNSARAVAISRAGNSDEFLLSYETFAMYINKSGLIARPGPRIRWRQPVKTLIFRPPYFLGFSSSHIEVRRLRTGELVQTIWINHSLLSTSPDLIVILAADGRLIALDISK